MDDKAEGLIAALLDKAARLDERDDAAMDLGKFDDEKVVAALTIVGSDATEDYVLLASCGESLAEIWSRSGSSDEKVLQHLAPAARDEATRTLAALKQRVPRR